MSRFRISAQKKTPAEPIPTNAAAEASSSTTLSALLDPAQGDAPPARVASRIRKAVSGVSESKGRDAYDGGDSGNEFPEETAPPAGHEFAASSNAHAILPFGNGATLEDQANAPYAGGVGVAPMARPMAETKHGMRQFVVSQHGVRVFIHNCVSTCNLTCSNPDMAFIATHVRNAEYNPQRFSAVIIRLREPKSTALFFHTGKLVVTGSKNEEDGRAAARLVGKIIHKLGFKCALADYRVQNMVCSGDVGFPVRLEGLADEHNKFASYEPELFAGLVYRMVNPHIVFLIFVSGKFVVTAAKSRSTIVEGINKLYPSLFAYRKTVTNVAPIGLDPEAAIKQVDSRFAQAVGSIGGAVEESGPAFSSDAPASAAVAASDYYGGHDEYEDVGM